MNARQQRFVDEFLKLGNATQAAIAAGYSKKTAKQIGSRLLSNVAVAAAIAKRQTKAAAKAELTAEFVTRGLMRLASVDPRKLFRPDGTAIPPHEWDDDTALAVQGLEPAKDGGWKIRFGDRKGSLELLGRLLGLFEQTLNLKGKIEVPAQVPVAALSHDQLRTIQEALAPALAPEPRPGPPQT